MDFRRFHNPNICLPIIRRRIGEELLDLFVWYLQVAATGGRSLTWNHSFPDRDAYRGALYRLRQAGLLVYRRYSDKKVFLDVTAKGKSRLPDVFKPERFWRKNWNGIWYVLVYDVPEKDRMYRNKLRQFLHRMRMGCLQRSVYVSPRDIRPEYNDMIQAADIGRYAFLLESQTVLGQSPMEIVESAWNFRRLEEIQLWYCDVYAENLERVLSGKLTNEALENLAREEMSAYLCAMEEDPMLPKKLLPPEYRGGEVYGLHRKLTREIAKRL